MNVLQAVELISRPMEFLENCAKRHGDSFTVNLLGGNSPPLVFFSHPQTIAKIFTTEAEKFEFGKVTYVFKPLTGAQSLIMLDGEQHQSMRNLLLPPLHGKKIQAYGHIIVRLTQEAISKRSASRGASWSEGSAVNIRDQMCNISLGVILQVVFGVKDPTRYKKLEKLIKSFLEKVNSPFNSLQFFFPVLQQNWSKFSPWGSFLHQRKQIDDLIYAEIASRRDQPPGDDILSLLMDATDEEGNSLSETQLRDQLMTLLLLGHETTASALSWAFYWIHQNYEISCKLQKEIDSLTRNLDPGEIAKLPYLNAVCLEALRVNPIALIAQPRVVKQSLQLEDYSLEPGMMVVPCIYLTHRREDLYPNPQEFDPERFLARKFSPYEYFPFGGGVRTCVGMALSLWEMNLVLATVLSHYKLSLDPSTSITPVRRGITIVPSGGCKMIVEKNLTPTLSN